MSVPDSGVERSDQAVPAKGSLSASNSAIDELTKRLRANAGSVLPVAPQRMLRASGARRYAIPALVTICLLSAAVVFGARMWPTAGDTARTLASRVAATLPMLRNMMVGETAPTDDPPELPPARVGSRRSPHSARPLPPLASRRPVAPAFDAPKLLVERPPAAAVVPVEEPYDPIVYSSADPEVAPPKRVPDVSGTAPVGRRPLTDTLELLVNDQGIVEHATLHTWEPQMLDSMLLSRVKAWRFDPARRQGHSVAYRLLLVWNGSQFEPAPDTGGLPSTVRSAPR